MLTLLTIVCTVGGYAQEVLYSTGFETSEGYTTSSTYNTNVTVGPSGKQWYICNGCVSKTNKIDGGSSLHMRYYISNKKTPSAQMKFYIDGVTDLCFKAQTSSSGKIKVEYSTDKGTTWNGAKEYQISTTVSNISYQLSETPVNNVSIKITSLITADKKSVCIDDFKLLSSAPTTTTTTTTFGANSGKTFTFTNGTLEGFTTPTATATKSDDNTNLSNLIEYTSSDADIVAVDSKTGELTFTNTKFGKATITATLPKTDTYQTSTDSYVVENKDNHIATSLSFNGTDVTLTEGKTDAGADFTGYTATEASNIAGTITYAASGDAVATVTPTTGAVTINAAVYGTTTITATFTPTDPTQYSGSTATYQITNKKPVDLSEIVFDVKTDKTSKQSTGKDQLTKSIVKIESTSAALGGYGDYRFYGSSKTTFSLTDPTRVITSIKFVGGSYGNFTTDKPNYDKTTGTWTGYEESVVFTASPKVNNVTQIIVTTAEKKAAPALSFAEATVTKELVAGTIDLQTITKPEDLDAAAITYASSDNKTAEVSEGKIHMYKTGEVIITATSAATDKYAAGTASYKLVIEDNRATDADFKFAEGNYKVDMAGKSMAEFNAKNVLQNPNNLKVTYTISPKDENVEIDASSGYIVISKRGIYTITATGDANDTYKETTAKCTLKVFDSTKQDETFTFIAGLHKGTQTGNSKEDQIVQDVVTIHGTNAAFAAITDTEYTYRLYQNSSTTISTKVGKITKIEFIGSNNSLSNYSLKKLTSMTDNNYTCTDHNYGVWEGFAKEVEFKAIAQVRAIQIIVTILIPKEYTMDETKTKNVIEDCAYANVTLQRTLEASHWNSFCVPFALDKDQVTQYFGEGTQLRTYEGRCENNIVYFATVDNIEAGKPYIMKPGNAVVKNPTFEGVSIVATGLDKNGNPQAVGDASTVQMKGIYNHVTLVQDKTNIYIGAGNKFYYPADAEACQMNGLRAYFIVPEGTDIKKLRANLDGATTSLGEIFDTEESNTPVYNLQGQCVGNSLSTLKSGIYVQNGKKVVVK